LQFSGHIRFLQKQAITVLLLAMVSFHLKAQDGFDNPSRARYILDISKYVSWKDSSSFNQFSIGILSQDSGLYRALSILTKKEPLLHGKPIVIKQFADVLSLSPTQVLYLNKAEGIDIHLAMSKIRNKQTLLISENFEFHQSMINFIVLNGKKRFEINEKRMEEEGFTVSTLFRAQAVKNMSDWQDLYSQIEVELEAEKVIAQKREQEITRQLKQISEQQSEISALEKQSAKLRTDYRDQMTSLFLLKAEYAAKSLDLDRKRDSIRVQQNELNKQYLKLREQNAEMRQQQEILAHQNDKIRQQVKTITQQEQQVIEQINAIEKQRLIVFFFIILSVLLAGLGYYIYRGYRQKKQSNLALKEKNMHIVQKNREILKQNEEIEQQRNEITLQKQHIMSSITYAQRIQSAMLPDENALQQLPVDHFVLYLPKDIVSGDFYWTSQNNRYSYLAVADCTGHGVPGAFMSMMGISFLNEMVRHNDQITPSRMLDKLREHVITALRQSGEEMDAKDGIEMALLRIDNLNQQILFAGANLSLIKIRNGETETIKGTRMPLCHHPIMNPFEEISVDVKAGDCFYAHSDGFVDQFGGTDHKKFLSKRFRELLLSIQPLSMSEQRESLQKAFVEWRGNTEQYDDVVVVGLRF
jgi:serine phosphatase RsbU (regulator of sigma subunit)